MDAQWNCKGVAEKNVEMQRHGEARFIRAMELHRPDMICSATAQFGIADNSMAMALPRDAAQRKCNELRRFAKSWKSVEEQGTATAMYARRRID